MNKVQNSFVNEFRSKDSEKSRIYSFISFSLLITLSEGPSKDKFKYINRVLYIVKEKERIVITWQNQKGKVKCRDSPYV